MMAEPLVKQDTITSWYLNRTPVIEYLKKKPKKEKSVKVKMENTENFSWYKLIQNIGKSEEDKKG